MQPQQEREVSGVAKNGKPRYSTRHWAEITNQGTVDAQEVTFEPVGDETGLIISGTDKPTTIHRGQTRRLPLLFTWGSSNEPILRIRWVEDGEPKERNFHVG